MDVDVKVNDDDDSEWKGYFMRSESKSNVMRLSPFSLPLLFQVKSILPFLLSLSLVMTCDVLLW